MLFFILRTFYMIKNGEMMQFFVTSSKPLISSISEMIS